MSERIGYGPVFKGFNGRIHPTVLERGESDQMCGVFTSEGGVLRAPGLVRVQDFGLRTGYSTTFFLIDGEHASPASPALIRLLKSAVITGRITDRRGKPLPALGFWVDAALADFLPEETDVVRDKWPLTWSATTIGGGRFRLENLPANIPLRYHILLGSKILLREERGLVLAPGETLERTWKVELTASDE